MIAKLKDIQKIKHEQLPMESEEKAIRLQMQPTPQEGGRWL
jgi:hypothetical protein